MTEIRTVGVIGSGTMGSGIAQVFAQAGYEVRLQDVSAPALDRARAGIEKSLAKFVEKGKLTAADRDGALGRLAITTTLDGFAEVDCVVEAIVEDVGAKRELFGQIDAIVPGRSSTDLEHLLDLDYHPRSGHRSARARARDALHEPRAVDDARRADSRPGDER